jgi:hypothetical protein
MDAGWRLVFGSAGPAEAVRTVRIDPASKPGLEEMWDHATAAWNALALFAGDKPTTGRLFEDQARPTD